MMQFVDRVGKEPIGLVEWFSDSEEPPEPERFGCRGMIEGHATDVEWVNSELTGDLLAVTLLKSVATTHEGRLISITSMGIDSVSNHLAKPLVARLMMWWIFDEILEWTGDVPMIPAVPDGAIA